MQSPGLARPEAFAQIVGMEQVQVAHLGAIDADDPEQAPGGHLEGGGLPGRNDNLVDLDHPSPCCGDQVGIQRRDGLRRVTNDDRDGRPLVGIGRCWMNGFVFHPPDGRWLKQ